MLAEHSVENSENLTCQLSKIPLMIDIVPVLRWLEPRLNGNTKSAVGKRHTFYTKQISTICLALKFVTIGNM